MDIRILDMDDWKGIYVNGKLFAEGHTLTIREIIHAVAPDVNYAIADGMELDIGTCPTEWTDELEALLD